MGVKDLVYEQSLIHDTIYQLKEQIIDEEIKRDKYEADLWVNTKFKELGLTNNEQRKAYIKQQMGLYISKVGHLKNDLTLAENELNLCKTKIRLCMELGIDFDDEGTEE